MRPRSLSLAAVAAALFLAVGWSGQGYAGDIKIGAMPLGSSWYVFGATLSKLIQEKLPPGSKVDVIPRGGGVSNPIAVNEGKAEVALANVATAVWAWNGHPEVYKGKQYRNIRALVGGLNSVYIGAMLREEYIRRTGNETLEKALLSDRPPRIIMKPAGSTVPPSVDIILVALGTSREKLKAKGGEILQVDVSQIPTLVRDGRADLYFESVIPGHPATTEVSLTGEVRFVDLPEKALQALAKQGMTPREIPAVFKGQAGPTKAADFGTVLVANKDLPADIAYLITKTLCENKEAMVAAHKAWRDFEPATAWRPEKTGIPLHSGAEKYYKERGWMR